MVSPFPDGRERSSWDCDGLDGDAIEYKVDKSVFVPVRLVHVKLESLTYPSKLLESCQNFSYHGLEVLFSSNPSLKKNTLYHIRVLISGAKSGKGCKGLKSVTIAGVTFTFSSPLIHSVDEDMYRSSVWQGQFAEFLFSLPN